MSNGSNNFYDKLSRLLRIVQRHQGIELSAFYAKGRRVVKESVKWKLSDYTFKMLNDGQVYTVDEHLDGVFVRRVIYTTDYKRGGSE